MKSILLFSFLIISSVSFSQRTLTGLWTGSLTHDSAVGRKDLSFELALTQYKQKVYGYTRRTFIVHDTLFYVVKRVKGKIDRNVCEITDDEYISLNFGGQIDKNVKVTYTFNFSETDSSWLLDGNWKTNKVKKTFRSVSGSINIQQEKDLENSKLLAHLEELKLADDVAFYKESKTPVAASPPVIADNKKQNNQKPKNTEVVKNEKPKPASAQPPITTKEEKQTEQSVAASRNQEKLPEPGAGIVKNEEKTVVNPPAKKEEKQIESATALANKEEKNKPTSTGGLQMETVKNQTPPPITVIEEKTVAIKPAEPEPKVPLAAAKVMERKTLPPQIVDFKTDSLELSLYDNGEVDGDTVSVLLNGEVIMAKQGLKASAVKKMIYFPKGGDEFKLVLYAENLGKYPPNTGLLIIHDGEDVHQLRFSADLQQNAAVIFRRKK